MPELNKAIEDIYRYPLLQSATDTLNRQLKSGIDDPGLSGACHRSAPGCTLVSRCRGRGDCGTQIICSLGLRKIK